MWRLVRLKLVEGLVGFKGTYSLPIRRALVLVLLLFVLAYECVCFSIREGTSHERSCLHSTKGHYYRSAVAGFRPPTSFLSASSDYFLGAGERTLRRGARQRPCAVSVGKGETKTTMKGVLRCGSVGSDSTAARERQWDYKLHGADWGPLISCSVAECARQSPVEVDMAAVRSLQEKLAKSDAASSPDPSLDVEVLTSTGNSLRLGCASQVLTNFLAEATQECRVVFDPGFTLKLEPLCEGDFGFLQRGSDGEGAGEGAKRFCVRQIHFHAPAEHTRSGERAALELHVVCAEEEAPKQLLVLGVLFQPASSEAPSEGDGFLDQVEAALARHVLSLPRAKRPALPRAALNELLDQQRKPKSFFQCLLAPFKKQKEKPLPHPLELRSLLPAEGLFLAYEGSLTTPPCTENVHW